MSLKETREVTSCSNKNLQINTFECPKANSPMCTHNQKFQCPKSPHDAIKYPTLSIYIPNVIKDLSQYYYDIHENVIEKGKWQ
jgi:hypothetical protein